jgi:hypothetical protein
MNMDMEVKYEGKSWESRVTEYSVVMGNFSGGMNKHNGQFVHLDLFLNLEGYSWQVYYGNIVANNNKELKQIIEEKISEFKPFVTELYEFMMKIDGDTLLVQTEETINDTTNGIITTEGGN